MILVDAIVLRVISIPQKIVYKESTWWSVKVEYSDCRGIRTKDLLLNELEDARKVVIGYKFQH